MKYNPSILVKNGQKYAHLTVIEILKVRFGHRVTCKCDCGITITRRYSLIFGHKRLAAINCGDDKCKFRQRFNQGLSKSPEYAAWRHMIQRCYIKSRKDYPRYGGRGIRVCKRWIFSFPAFLKNMGKRPSEIHSLERKNNNGNYTPKNCKWATRIEQARNKRNNCLLTCDGKTATAPEWSEITGLTVAAIKRRRSAGWKDEEIIKTPKLTRPRHREMRLIS